MEEYYNDKYFDDYQKKIGEFGGKANLFKFKKFIKHDSKVLDFGCGGGFLLNNINCSYKVGIEINSVARNFCKSNFNINSYENISEVEDNNFDVIISNHALEHCERPDDILKKLFKKLKKGGKIIIVTPLDSLFFRFDIKDVNKHLYSFSPMNLGNLLVNAGFNNIKTGTIFHKWPPKYNIIQSFFGWNIFHFFSRIYGLINLYWTQTIGIAEK